MRAVVVGRIVGLSWLVVGCGGSGEPVVDVVSGTDSVAAQVGREGAVLELKDQARVTIPRDALSERTEIRMGSLDLDSLPQRPGSRYRDFGRPIVVRPHGLELGRTATLELRVGRGDIADRELRVLRLSNPDDRSWERLDVRVLRSDEASRGSTDLRSRRSDDDTLTRERRAEVRVKGFSVFMVVREEAAVQPGACEGMEAGTECRPSRGRCDPAEVCDGDSADCPDDVLADAGAECRAAAHDCDVAEVCDGESAGCPADVLAAAGSACTDDGAFCTGEETCDASGNCVSSGDPCAAGVDETDGDCAESCDEDADDCTGPNPDGLACFPSVCAEGECQAGACATVLECPVFVDSRGDDVTGCGTAFGAAACATLAQGNAEAGRTDNRRVFVRNEVFTASGTAPVLTMGNDIAYYGGFEGTENLLDERPDPIPTPTTLDGNGTAGHVVVGAPRARLDGFVVTGGVGASEGGFFGGGGMYNQATDGLVIAHSIFSGNVLPSQDFTYLMGAGLFNDAVAGLQLEDVQVVNNTIQHWGNALGAGMASLNSTVSLSNVEFSQNAITGSSSGTNILGGALYDEGTSTTFDGVAIGANRVTGLFSTAHGAGYAATGTSFTTTLTSVAFQDNSVAADTAFSYQRTRGAGMHVEVGGVGESLDLTDVTFEGNTSNVSGQGGGLYVSNVAPTLTGVSFVDNSLAGGGSDSSEARGGGGMYLEADGATAAKLRDVQFVGNRVNALGSNNARGGGMYAAASVDARNVDFIGNLVTDEFVAQGGGMYFDGGGGSEVLTLASVSFVANGAHATSQASESAAGGGLYANTSEGSAQLTHVSFVENELSGYFLQGVGMFMAGSCGAADCAFDQLAFGGPVVLDARGLGSPVPEFQTFASTGLSIGTYCGSTAPGFGADFTDVGTYTDQFETAASGHVFLTPTSVCRDAGANAASDAALGADVWRTLTTRLDGTLDIGSADHGRLYEPAGPWITRFEAVDATTLEWEVRAPAGTTCRVTDASFSHEVPAAEIATGGVDLDPLAKPSIYELRCTSGGVIVRAKADTR